MNECRIVQADKEVRPGVPQNKEKLTSGVRAEVLHSVLVQSLLGSGGPELLPVARAC